MNLENAYKLIKDVSSLTAFRFIHYSLIVLQMREELCSELGMKAMPRYWHPFTLWLSNMLVVYAGEMCAELLICSTPLEILRNWHDLLLYTVVWYSMYYSPLDKLFIIARTSTYRVVAIFASTVSMVMNVDKAMQNVLKIFGKDWLPIVIIGATVGSGGELLKPVFSFIINRCHLNNAAHVKLSMNSKLALFVAFVYALELVHRDIFGLCHEQIQLGLMGLLLVYKCFALVYPVDHYIWLIETKLCYTLFGGWLTDLIKLCTAERYLYRANYAKFD